MLREEWDGWCEGTGETGYCDAIRKESTRQLPLGAGSPSQATIVS